MAKSLTPQDARDIVTAVYRQITNQSNISIIDTSSFVSAGETILSYGTEKTINALSMVIGRTLASVRPYKAKFNLVDALSTGLYNTRIRKISYYSKAPQNSGDWNTNLFTNHAEGYDNGSNGGQSVASMWVQNQPKVVEMNFCGQDVWQDCLTMYENQLKVAFTDESSFNAFISGILTQKANDIELQKESFNRMAILDRIAGEIAISSIYDSGSVINLTTAFNTKYGTSYTRAQLLSTYAEDFAKFFAETITNLSDLMSYSSVDYHLPLTKVEGNETYKVLRHTPKANQKLALYAPLMTSIKTNVMPTIFNTNYLSIDNYEPVMFWQSKANGAAIKVKPAIPDVQANGSIGNAGQSSPTDAIENDFIVGCMFDNEALQTCFQFETARTTPVEARKGYVNTWYSYSKNIISDYSENFIVFTM